MQNCFQSTLRYWNAQENRQHSKKSVCSASQCALLLFFFNLSWVFWFLLVFLFSFRFTGASCDWSKTCEVPLCEQKNKTGLMQSCHAALRDALFELKKPRSARALHFPNNCPLLSVAVKGRIILSLINKELISVKLPLTLLQRLRSSLGGTQGARCTLGNVELCRKWKKPGLNPQAGQCFWLYSVLVFITWNKCPLHSNLFEHTRTVTNLSGFVSLLRFSAEMCFFISVCLLLNFCVTCPRFPCNMAYYDPE